MNQPPNSLPPPLQPPPRVAPPPATETNRGHAGVGVAIAILTQPLTLLIAFASSAVGMVEGYAGLVVLMAFGLAQYLYIVPIGIWLHSMGKTRTALGLWITSGIIFLLNAGCWGLLAMSNLDFR